MNGFERRENARREALEKSQVTDSVVKNIIQQKTFIIAEKDNVQSEDDIFIIRANTPDDAIIQYAHEYYSKNEYFKESIEDRAINMTFWEKFFLSIFTYESSGITTNLNDHEIDMKFKENIKKYVEGNKKYSEALINFFYDRDKTYEELPLELIEYIALKEVQEEREKIIIKEL